MTEEEAKQAIVDAALAWDADGAWTAFDRIDKSLHDAVAAYRKATTPEPTEGYMGRNVGGPLSGAAYPNLEILSYLWDEVWKVTVTPIERVR